jgi:methionine-rich copper-binding protein CopC
MRRARGYLRTLAGRVVRASAIALSIAPGALAHARLVSSVPAPNAEVREGPKRLELQFDELLDLEFNSVQVYSASEYRSGQRHNLARDSPRVNASDRTRMTCEISPLPPGQYIVEWRVLSRDGHTTQGRFSFHVVG